MLNLDPVKDDVITATVGQLVREAGFGRRGATLRHFARVQRLSRSGRLVSEVRAEQPDSVPWVLTTCVSESSGAEPTQPGEHEEQLKGWFVESLAGVGETRWTEEGLTLVDQPRHVTDAVTYGNAGRLDAFTRRPLKNSRTDGYDLVATRLETRVVYPALIARDWFEALGVNGAVYIDVSMVSVGESGLLSGPGNHHRTEFSSDYIHLSYHWEEDEDAPKRGLVPLCDQLWQAGGKTQSYGDMPEGRG